MKRVILTLLSSLAILFAGSIVHAQAATLTLTWQDNSTNETGFQVERCVGTNCTNFTLLGAPGLNVTTYVDSTLADGTTYCYRVRAINAGGASSYTNVACGTTAVPLPSAPSNLTVK